MAPKSIDDVIGQKELLGKGKVLRNLVKNKKLFSMILYGKPGIGKTSIAQAMIHDVGMRYRFLNAVSNTKKDIEVVIEEAKMYGELVLILDEIHRLNKDKQDILLPHLESGLIILIGMTTSNPYHKINPAIRSRCQLYELKALTEKEIEEGIKKALNHEDLEGIIIGNEEIRLISKLANHDLRYAYNLLEVAFYSTEDKKITLELLKNISGKANISGDKDEEEHYDLLSAFQKSIRGSNVDAAIHYLARLIVIGDLDSIYRRMSVICYEDIGLANPDMGPRVKAAIDACELVGLPEARIPLAEIVVELALSPKSNTAYLAIDKALKDVETGRCGPVPETIRIHTTTYKYPHDFPNNFVVQQYLPNNLQRKKYYIPKDTSPNERMLKQIKEKLDRLIEIETKKAIKEE